MGLKNRNNHSAKTLSNKNLLKNKHSAIRFYISIFMVLALIGMTIFTILKVYSEENDLKSIHNSILIFTIVISSLFAISIALIFIDIKYQLDSRITDSAKGLLQNYDVVYLVDPNSDKFKILKSDKVIAKKSLKKLTFLNEINKYIDNKIYFKDSATIKDELDYVVINKKLESKNEYSIYYREFNGLDVTWTDMHFSRFSPELLLVSISRKDTKLLEEKLNKSSEDDCFALFTVDLDTNEIKTIITSPMYKQSGKPGTVSRFDSSIKAFAETQEGETKDLFINLSNLNFIKQELLTDDKRVFFYKSSEHIGGSWFSVTCYVLFRNADGTPASISLGFNKLDTFGNDKQDLQLQLKDALSLAESANKAKTLFINSMSHKIRPPMNAIIGYANLAANHMDSMEQVGDYLGKITQSSGYLLSLINDIIDMSRIESGKITLEEKHEDLREIIHSLSEIIQANVQSKEIKFENSVDIINKNIICDKVRLKQALLNILSNAAKFTQNGGNISFLVKQLDQIGNTAGKYEFRIIDDGVGMSKEFLDQMFIHFAKEKINTKSRNQGTGLGMAITKNIITMMNGEISISSTPNKGTEVVVTLPLQYSDENVVTVVENSKTYTERDFVGMKVLIVEDNPINREIETDLLHDYGFVIKCVEDGDIAIDTIRHAKEGDFDFILMDIQMPRTDGYEATRQIRALNTPISKIPIFAMTANTFKKDRIKALESGMNEHLAKPMQIEPLFAILSKYVKGKNE